MDHNGQADSGQRAPNSRAGRLVLEDFTEAGFEFYRDHLAEALDPTSSARMLLLEMDGTVRWLVLRQADLTPDFLLALRCALLMSATSVTCLLTAGSWQEQVPGAPPTRRRVVVAACVNRHGDAHYRFAPIERSAEGLLLGERRVISPTVAPRLDLLRPIGAECDPARLAGISRDAFRFLVAINSGPKTLQRVLQAGAPTLASTAANGEPGPMTLDGVTTRVLH